MGQSSDDKQILVDDLELSSNQGIHDELRIIHNNKYKQNDSICCAELKQDIAKMKLLQNISMELLYEDNIQGLYERFIDTVMEIMNSNFVSMQILCYDENESKKLNTLASRGFTWQAVEAWKWVYSDSTFTSCAEALRTGKRVIVPNVEECDFMKGTSDLDICRLTGIHASQSTPLYSRDGRMIGMISTHWTRSYQPSERELSILDIVARQAADLIERKLAEEELMQNHKDLEIKCQELIELKQLADNANSAKSQFLANMSHEIRTPLNGVIALTDLLSMTELSLKQMQMVNTIKSSSNRLLLLINDVLELSKIDAGKLELRPELIDFESSINEETSLYSSLAKQKGLEYEVIIDNDVPNYMITDKNRLIQIICNLVGNAIKFTNNGKVSLLAKKLKQDENRVQILISIKDTGIGIKQEDLPKLFGYFYQLDSTISKKYQGTGLGLAISKSLVNLLGGEITVESVFGKGSIFSFTFTAELPIQPKLSNNLDTTSIEREKSVPKILLVDDDEVCQLIIELFCENMGWNLQVASNGKEALKILDNEQKDIILMDIQMPEINGFDVTKIIREKETLNATYTPIIATTAYSRAEDKEKCLKGGMDDIVTKPIDLRILKDVILHLIK